MLVIGLCGGSGSGKGEVCRAFLEHSIPSIDTDAVYHRLTAEKNSLTDALAERFGADILDERGALLRPVLAKKVFAADGAEALADLNRITHFHILNVARVWLEEQRKNGVFAAIVDAPLLFESGFDKECDITVCVTAPRQKRIERIVLRDGISCEAAQRRIASQKSDAYLIERCGYHIDNCGDVGALRARVKRIVDELREKENM